MKGDIGGIVWKPRKFKIDWTFSMPESHDPAAFILTLGLLLRENSWIFVGGDPQYRFSDHLHEWSLYGIVGTDRMWDEEAVREEFVLWAEHQGWAISGDQRLLPGETEIGLGTDK